MASPARDTDARMSVGSAVSAAPSLPPSSSPPPIHHAAAATPSNASSFAAVAASTASPPRQNPPPPRLPASPLSLHQSSVAASHVLYHVDDDDEEENDPHDELATSSLTDGGTDGPPSGGDQARVADPHQHEMRDVEAEAGVETELSPSPIVAPTEPLAVAEAAALASAPHVFACSDLFRAEWWRAHANGVLSFAPTLVAFAGRVLMWAALMVPMGCLVGLFSALFLASVDGATHARFDAPWLLYLLPLSGALQAVFYRRWARVPSGQRAFGVDFIIEQVHNPDTRRGRASVPARMGWMAWAGTVVSHLCGASVGREGTGLQLAASLANSYSWLLHRGSFGRLHLSRAQHRALTVASMAAGFAGVFATPFAATLFSLEVLEAGSGLATENIVPAIMAAASADIVAGAVLHALGKHHTAYPPSPPSGTDGAADELEVRMLLLVCVAALFFGLIARLFSWAIHALQSGFRALFASWSRTSEWGWLLTPILGGGLVIALVGIFGGDRTYLGIGTLRPEGDTRMVFLPSCFSSEGPCTDGAWAAKALFTVVSLASGYKGGEVTCLFFVGASAGWAVAQWFSLPSATHLFASAGFVSVFGAASNTPLASTLMAVELFGVSGGVGGGGRVLYYAAACAVSYVVSGQNGIYRAQRSTMTHKLARHERDDSSSSGGGRRRNPQQGPHVLLEEVADAPAVSGVAGQQMA